MLGFMTFGVGQERDSTIKEQLSIDFVHKLSQFKKYFLDINSPVDQVQS